MKNIPVLSQIGTKKTRGFTLIELLVVIGILAVLLAIVLVAINPARQFAQANNTQRRSDVNALLNAVHQYGADNNGDLSALGITSSVTAVSDTGIDLCAALVPSYIAALPADPTVGNPVAEADCASTYDTGYTIVSSATNNRITVSAPNAELTASISATR